MTARQAGYVEHQVPDMERRIAGMVRLGTIHSQDFSDPAAPRVRVQAGNFLTGWIPWTVNSAGGDTDWEPLDVGSQVIMAAPSGDMAQAVVLGSIHQSKHGAPSLDPDERGRQYKDGTKDTYNRASHTRTIAVPQGGKIVFSVGASSLEITDAGISFDAPAFNVKAPNGHFSGSITSDGDQVAHGVSQAGHVHSGVQPGPSNTAEPVVK